MCAQSVSYNRVHIADCSSHIGMNFNFHDRMTVTIRDESSDLGLTSDVAGRRAAHAHFRLHATCTSLGTYWTCVGACSCWDLGVDV